MKKTVLAFPLFLLVLLAFPTFQQGGVSAGASQQASAADSEQPPVIDGRDMPYLSMMASYANTSQINDWTVKTYPMDTARLDDTLFNDSYVQVYVSDVKDIIQPSVDEHGEVVHAIRVYVPSDSVVNQLSEIAHEVFYVSMYTPSILMVVDKEGLQQIANNPAVYCIRILPQNDFVWIPEGLSFATVVALTSIAVVAGSICLRKRQKFPFRRQTYQFADKLFYSRQFFSANIRDNVLYIVLDATKH